MIDTSRTSYNHPLVQDVGLQDYGTVMCTKQRDQTFGGISMSLAKHKQGICIHLCYEYYVHII